MDLTAIGPYRVIKKLGAGGMGEVYLADDPRLDRNVALKRVSSSRVATPEARDELRREARAAAKLSHPNIAVIYDVIEVDDDPYIVMEYVEGQTLLERRREGSMTPQDVIDIGCQVTRALAEAHRHGIIHRDLKPANILLTPSGTAKVLDFGLARIQRSRESENSTAGSVVGTLAYMAPEQMLGYRADHRCDIYALGVVLFELATGRSPSQRREDRQLVLEDMRKSAPRASDFNPKIPDELSDVIARAMSWEPRDRPQSVEEIEGELQSIGKSLEDEPTRTRRWWSTVRRADRPRRTGARLARVGAGASALLLAVVLGWFSWNARRERAPEGPPVVAVVPLENVSGDTSIDHIGVGIAHALITKLSAVPSVTTISPMTLLQYGADSMGPMDLARDLGASFVVNGSVQRMRDTLHITVNLVRADDSVAWGGEFEGPLEDLFELQSRISAGLSGALHLNLTPQQQRRLDEPPTSNMDAYAQYSQGRYFLEVGHGTTELSRGLRLLESAVESDPNFALAYAALGEGYWKRFQQTTDRTWTEKARAAAEQALTLDPDHPAAHYALAVIYNGSGQGGRAMDALRQALALQPNYDDAYRLVGKILASEGDVDGAARELRQAIAIRPGFWGHHRALGLVFYRAGRFAEAAAKFQKVTELQPDLVVGFQSLGATYHMMGDLDRAVPNYEKAIELSPNAPSLNNLGTVYYRQGKFTEAVRSYEKALDLEPNRAVTHRNLGDAYRRLGDTKRGHAAYRRAAELHRNVLDVNPRDAPNLALLALIQAKLGNHDEAIGLARQAVELTPDDPQVLYNNAVVHVFAERTDEAIDALRLAVEHGYGVSELREDDDLDPLREMRKFRNLLSGIEKE